MSISALVNTDIERSTEKAQHRTKHLIDRAKFLALQHNLAANDVANIIGQAANTAQPSRVTAGANALESLVKYVPTESVTLYLAALSAGKALEGVFAVLSPRTLYWFFLILTPVIYILIFIGKRRANGLSTWPNKMTKWPVWNIVASLIAFAAWGLVVPSPDSTSPLTSAAFTFLAVFVSTVLSLLGSVFQPAGTSA